MSKEELKPIDGADARLVAEMIRGHVEQRFDDPRMRQFWTRLLAGKNDPAEVAEGICLALSHGKYVPRPRADGRPIQNITIQVHGLDGLDQAARIISGAGLRS